MTLTNSTILNYVSNISDILSSDAQDGAAIVKRNGSIKLYPVSKSYSGDIEVQLEAQIANLACVLIKKQAKVAVGCPPSKTVHFVPPTAFVPSPPPTPRYDWNAKFSPDYKAKKSARASGITYITSTTTTASPTVH